MPIERLHLFVQMGFCSNARQSIIYRAVIGAVGRLPDEPGRGFCFLLFIFQFLVFCDIFFFFFLSNKFGNVVKYRVNH